MDDFVDALARRIASFDRRAIGAAKGLVNQVSLPSADRLLAAITSFQTALTWPESQQRIRTLLERGLQKEGDFETRWPEALGTLLGTQSIVKRRGGHAIASVSYAGACWIVGGNAGDLRICKQACISKELS